MEVQDLALFSAWLQPIIAEFQIKPCQKGPRTSAEQNLLLAQVGGPVRAGATLLPWDSAE